MRVGTAESLHVSFQWGDLVELAKPRITLMVLITTAAGAYMAAPATFSPLLVFGTLIATGCLAGAASAINQVLEAESDALMVRTAHRPLAEGRLEKGPVLLASLGATALALAYLALRVNLLTAALGAITWASYLFIYTPMKKHSPLSTLAGAVPGAVPPLMGWAATAGRLEPAAWVLFGLLFLWQIPHFLAIAWMYREDYERGGIPVLPVIDRRGVVTAWCMVLFTVATLAVSLLPSLLGVGGATYSVLALLFGAAFLMPTIGFAGRRTRVWARRVLLASVVYLPAVMIAMVWTYLPVG